MDRTSGNQSGGRSTAAITVALCYLVALCEGFDLQAAGVAAPALGPAFHMNPGQLGWFFSASTFGLLIGAALGGRLSDRFGRKPILLFSVAVFGIMSVLTSLALGPQTLLAARFLTGAGIGGALPNLVALTAENTAPQRKNTAVGMLYAGLPSGGALASLTAMLGGAHDWRTVFAVGGVVPLIAVPLLFFVLPDSQAMARLRQAGPAAQAAKAAGFATAIFADNRALRSLLLWVGFFLSLLTMYLLLNWLPTLLVERGLSRADASLVQIAFNIFGALASVAAGALMDRLPMPAMMVLAFGSAAVALLLLAGAPPALAASVAVGALVGATMSANQAALYAVAPSVYPTAVRGAGVGLAVAIGRLGSAAGPLLAGVLLGSGQSPQQVLFVLVPIILVAGAAAVVLSLVMKRAESGAEAIAA
jgi:AAHS family 3-hydroxyphenylpropionic acid transporter